MTITDQVSMMDKMIDLHTHILPGIDDGARDAAMALRMAQQAVERGIEVVAATPHFMNLTWDQVRAETEKLRKLLADHRISLTVVAGAELFVDPGLMDLAKDNIPTYNDAGKYCLIEFPMLELPSYIDQVLFSLQVKGITPIIAHPERNRVVIREPNLVAHWIGSGCLIQINANSLLGNFGADVQRIAEIMLQHQMVHFIASDAHSVNNRGFYLDRSVESAWRLVTRETAALLVSGNPARVIAGEQVEVPEVISYRPQRRFWNFWKQRRDY